MQLLEALLAGVLQGLLEWLPVSSSGQLSLYYMLLCNVSPATAYKLSLALHLGTALSAIIYYHRRLMEFLRDPLGPVGRMLLATTAAAVIVAAPIYLAFTGILESMSFDYATMLVGALLVATGLALMVKPRGEAKKIATAKLRDWILAGAVEGLAVLPGLSRSAVTIACLCLEGFNPEDAVEASFMMAIPVTLLAGLAEAQQLQASMGGLAAIAALVASVLVGLASIKAMMILARRLKDSLAWFLVILGALIMLLHAPLLLQTVNQL